MKWSIKLGRLWGIDVYLHTTFLLLLAIYGLSSGIAEGNLGAGLSAVIYFVSLFLCVLLHEYGHALAARRYGIPTRDITLLPIGGVARLERIPDNPKQELVIALAGPAVNVFIAGALLAFLILAGIPLRPGSSPGWISLAQQLLVVNVFLVAFNLLPAFPMDGGRVLRALLSMAMDDPVRATQVAAVVGKVMAAIFAVVGLYLGHIFLVIIAVFVWMGAGGEASAAVARSVMNGVTVARAMLTQFAAVSPSDSLGAAAQLVLRGSQTDFPVLADGQVVGVLTRPELFTALSRDGELARVDTVMRRDFATLDAGEPLEPALNRLVESGLPLAPVVWQNQLVGILTLDNASEFLVIQRARRSGTRTPPTAAPPPLSR